MTKSLFMVIATGILLSLVACSEKKKSTDIITQRVEKVKPQSPERMQEYDDSRDVTWIGKQYKVTVHRQPGDSLSMVKDETGQKFVDNIISVSVFRADGSKFFSRNFTKSDFLTYLDDDYIKTGILEGLVFDKAEGDFLLFGASVGHPQSDEYIPLVFKLSRMGDLSIKRDTQMDNPPADEDEENLR